MNRQDRRQSERARQRRAAQVRKDMKDALARDSRYRYVIFLDGVPGWPDSFPTEAAAKVVLRKLTRAMLAENPADTRVDGFEIRPVLPSKAQ